MEDRTSSIPKCQHGVYDPHGDQHYCTVCNPYRMKGEIIKRINTTVGRLTLVAEIGQPVIKDATMWGEIE